MSEQRGPSKYFISLDSVNLEVTEEKWLEFMRNGRAPREYDDHVKAWSHGALKGVAHPIRIDEPAYYHFHYDGVALGGQIIVKASNQVEALECAERSVDTQIQRESLRLEKVETITQILVKQIETKQRFPPGVHVVFNWNGDY